MYRAKSMGKNCHVIFEPEMHEVVKRQLTLEADLAEAFANREFFLVYQPIVELETGRPTGPRSPLALAPPEAGRRRPWRVHLCARVLRPHHRCRAFRARRGMPAG